MVFFSLFIFVDCNGTIVHGGAGAGHDQNHKNRQEPEELLSPSPKWINQQRSDEEQLEVNCQVPSVVQALKNKS
jgi:hypothetical protein